MVGGIPWTVTAICETFEDLLSDGKTPYERRFGMPNVTLSLRMSYRDYINLVQKSCQVYSSIMYCMRVNLARRHYDAQFLRLFGVHSDVNDAHRAGANRLKNKTNIEKNGGDGRI